MNTLQNIGLYFDVYYLFCIVAEKEHVRILKIWTLPINNLSVGHIALHFWPVPDETSQYDHLSAFFWY